MQQESTSVKNSLFQHPVTIQIRSEGTGTGTLDGFYRYCIAFSILHRRGSEHEHKNRWTEALSKDIEIELIEQEIV
jgi:hypothetical protein